MGTRALGEKELVVVGFGSQSGKFSAVVRSGLSGQRSSAGLFDPPTVVVARFRGAKTLESLTQPVLKKSFPSLKSSLKHLLAAGFFARLWLAAWPSRDPDKANYQDMQALLDALDHGLDPIGVGLLGQHALLERLGLGISLSGCLGCGAERMAHFLPEEGGLLCAQCANGRGLPIAQASVRLLAEIDLQRRQQQWDMPVVRDCSVAEVGLMYREQFRFHLDLPDKLFQPVYHRRKL